MTASQTFTQPVLIYAPGLGKYEANSADGIGAALARVLTRNKPGETYSTKSDATVTAPRGLRVGVTIVDSAGTPALQLFELDYRDRLEGASGPAGPEVAPGALKSSMYAAEGAWRLVRALPRGGKSMAAKMQFAFAFFALGLLVLSALVAIVSGLVALGVTLPSSITGTFGATAAEWTLGISGVLTLGTWAALRKTLLAMATTVQRLMRCLDNEERRGDTVAITLDDAVDGLRDNGWTGKIHVLGYSFGSLVLYDSLLPRVNSRRTKTPVAPITTVTTVGCPLDAVQLLWPDYSMRREPRLPADATWTNIFNAADVFGSNFYEKDDITGGPATSGFPSDVKVTSLRYLDERLTWWSIFKLKGFTTHGGYWGAPEEANCFDILCTSWID